MKEHINYGHHVTSGLNNRTQQNSGLLAATMHSILPHHYNLIKNISTALSLSFAVLLTGCEQPPNVLDSAELNNNSINSIDIIADTPHATTANSEVIGTVSLPISCRNQLIVDAFQNQSSSLQVKGCGTVKALLPDDNKGSRHQRFIVELEDITPTHTVLIAHNIDLAPKIVNLRDGDDVLFYGEYEYNPQGGVVHWTHHDPAARHQGGWIEHEGKRFE